MQYKIKPLSISKLKRRPARWYITRKSVVFQGIQVGFHRSVVDTQELICGGHHVDTVGLAFGAFLVHELVDRLIHWSML